MCGSCEISAVVRPCAAEPGRNRSTLNIVQSRLFRPALFFGFLVVIALLSLADRAPGLVKGAWRVTQHIGSRIERMAGFDLIDRGDVPFAFDTIGHLILWAFAGFLAYAAFGRSRSLVALAVALVTASAAVEVGQGLLTSTRRPQVTDLLANAVGVSAGLAVAVLTFALISLFGRLTRSLSG